VPRYARPRRRRLRETGAAAGQSLLISLGLTLLGEGVVIWFRSGGSNRLTADHVDTSSQLRD
jgi:hypothetical protein